MIEPNEIPETSCKGRNERPNAGGPESRTAGPFLSVSTDPTGCRPLLEPDTDLGRFRILRLLGRGALGDVYLAHDTVSDEPAAIKVVHLEPGSSPDADRVLRSSWAIQARIQDHRHVLKLHHLHRVQWGGSELLLLSMEHADGGTFRDWLHAHQEDSEIRRTRGLDHFQQICRGVAAAHEAGVWHLDLKPENFLRVHEVWKISDFSPSGCPGSGSEVQCQEPRCRFGTPAYMSPEHFHAQCREDLDARADIYALGIVLFEVLNPRGRVPFQGDDHHLRELHLRGSLPPLPGVGQAETRVMLRCLEKNPTDRYPDVQTLLDDLKGRQEPVEAAPPDIPREEVERIWEEVCRHIDDNRFKGVRSRCRRILEMQPDHTRARELLDALQERYDKAGRIYAAIDRDLNIGNLDEQGALLTEAVHLYPDHPEGQGVQDRLLSKARSYREGVEEGMYSLQIGNLYEAQAWFEHSRRLNRGVGEAEQPAQFMKVVIDSIQETRHSISRAMATGDQKRALTLARKIDESMNRLRTLAAKILKGGKT